MSKELEIKLKKEYILYFLLIILIIISIVPWFKEGIAVTDDFRHHVTKFWWIQYSLQHYGKISEWMPYIYSGWPLTEFYHSFSYYISIPFILLFAPVASLKASIVASLILSALTMFFATRKLTKNNEIASIAAIFYLFAPMHFEYAYMSGSLTRLWGYVFVPLVIAYFICMLEEDGFMNVIMEALSLSALAYTDVNITIAVLYCLFAYLVYHFFIKEKKIQIHKLKNLIICVILIIGLSVIWTLPYLLENHDSSTAPIAQTIFGTAPSAIPLNAAFIRSFGRDIDGQGTRSEYVGYAFIIFAALGIYLLKFKNRIIFSTLGILGLVLALYPIIFKYLPLGGAIIYGSYFLLIGVFFLSIIAATFIHKISSMKNGWLLMLALIILFMIDIWPAYTTNYWSNTPTEDYINTPQIMDAYNFIKEQPGIFRTYTLIGETPYIYTQKMEIGTEWTGYREGAFKPIRDLTDTLYAEIQKNLTDPSLYATLGYMGTKDIMLPCINGLEKMLPLLYNNTDVCVYDNPFFQELVTSPKKIQIAPQPTDITAQAFVLNDCISNCIVQKQQANIYNVDFEPENITFITQSNESSFILVRSSYFKQHWHAYVNGAEVQIQKAWPYYMLIEVPEGINKVEFRYEMSTIQKISITITVITALYIIWLIIKERKKRKEKL